MNAHDGRSGMTKERWQHFVRRYVGMVTGRVEMKYSNIRDIVVSCCVSPERETAFASRS